MSASTAATDLEDALNHKYRLLDGTLVPGATTISELLDWDGKSARMAGAAAKIAREGGSYRADWNAKRDVGTRVHGYCEKWLRGQDAEVEPGDEGYLDAFAGWLEWAKPITHSAEFIVLSEAGYGGRPDWLGTTAEHEGMGICDWKTGHAYKVPHTLQLALYRYADGIAQYDEDGALTGYDRPPLLAVRWCACVYLKANGTFDVVRYPADHDAFCAAKQLLDAYRWARAIERGVPR